LPRCNGSWPNGHIAGTAEKRSFKGAPWLFSKHLDQGPKLGTLPQAPALSACCSGRHLAALSRGTPNSNQTGFNAEIKADLRACVFSQYLIFGS
jgi:hypothetical protein